MVNPTESAAESGVSDGKNGGTPGIVDNHTSSQIYNKGGAKPRFNWKHRYLTSHGCTGSEGKARKGDSFFVSLLHQ